MEGDYAGEGESFHTPIARDFAIWVERLEAAERGDVPPGYVPWTTFFLQDGDGRLLGGIRLRHRLNARLWQDGGHIGYDVRPSERNRGHATRMLALVLEEARALGLPWVLLTVAPGNRASIRVMEKNGAYRTGIAEESGYFRYRIDLP